ncbi:hypothetical protein BV25DRAFT_347783 [Artomyces pyxidatus]|uniref:Uncharacterized protein n=1 Tax=Artomyces pyxidatus TaxID=48021 RepID=A0ACB8T8B9_9AGAM|nr:hypothetical protein BV25DRAFT_347783 [Artomyces pyxidatus]
MTNHHQIPFTGLSSSPHFRIFSARLDAWQRDLKWVQTKLQEWNVWGTVDDIAYSYYRALLTERVRAHIDYELLVSVSLSRLIRRTSNGSTGQVFYSAYMEYTKIDPSLLTNDQRKGLATLLRQMASGARLRISHKTKWAQFVKTLPAVEAETEASMHALFDRMLYEVTRLIEDEDRLPALKKDLKAYADTWNVYRENPGVL